MSYRVIRVPALSGSMFSPEFEEELQATLDSIYLINPHDIVSVSITNPAGLVAHIVISTSDIPAP